MARYTTHGDVDGGRDTARVPAAVGREEAARRAGRDAAAARYLTRTGNADLLEVLGLDQAPAGQPGICRRDGCDRIVPLYRAAPHGHVVDRRYCSDRCARLAKETTCD